MITPLIIALALFVFSSGTVATIAIVLCLLDAFGRTRDFLKTRRHIHAGVPLKNICRTHASSHCGRQSVWLAAYSLGHGAEKTVTKIYKDLGRKWWQILPDFFYKPSMLLKKKFYASFMGLR